MVSYEDIRAQEFAAAATDSIHGVELEVPKNSTFAQPGMVPISYCVCVTDPCECDGRIVWIEGSAIHGRRDTERKNRRGDTVAEFLIDPDATVLVESVVRAKASSLQPGGRRSRLHPGKHLPSHRGDCGCGGGGRSAAQFAASSYYDGQECGGNTLYDVYVEADGLDTTFYYVAVGSC